MIKVEIEHKKIFLWNLSKAHKVTIYKDNEPMKKLYLKSNGKNRSKLDEEIKRLKND